jgi:hypothetical protein
MMRATTRPAEAAARVRAHPAANHVLPSYTRPMPHVPEYLWFLDTLVCVRTSHRDSADRISLLEHSARQGDSPPLHVEIVGPPMH